MPARAFSADVRSAADVATIGLHGDINGDAEDALGHAYASASTRATVIVLDFSDVDFMNSTGIALIVGLLADALREGRSLQARGLSDHYREIFEITRLSEHITLIADPLEGEAATHGGTA